MHFLITAGGTREYIDPVRFISNASSGRMGYALARSALKGGHKVTLITAPTNLRKPARAGVIDVETAAQMFEVVKANFEKCDCLVMAAAVSDYTPAKASKTKIKKSSQSRMIKLKPTTDILKWAGENKSRYKQKSSKPRKRIIVGFALEDKNLRQNAEKKSTEKKLDMIVANSPAVIASDKSTVQMKLSGGDWVTVESADKNTIARKIIRFVEQINRA